MRPGPALLIAASLLVVICGGSGPAKAASRAGGRLWVSRSDDQDGSSARAMAVSRDATRVFVTGVGDGYGTIAYDAATGAQEWVAHYRGPRGQDDARDVAVSPDGSRVFVTGRSAGTGSGSSYATVAYDAASGAQEWVQRYNGPGQGTDQAQALVVSPDGFSVYVTGASHRTGAGDDYATVAYDAGTGAARWVVRYDDVWHHGDFATDLGVTPDGSAVIVTGTSLDAHGSADFFTMSYRAATGVRLWAARYNGGLDVGDYTQALALSPDGARAFVTGQSVFSDEKAAYATVAYDTATGDQEWASQYLKGPGQEVDVAYDLAASPDGSKVFVTGRSEALSEAFATVAYDAETGARAWVRRYDGPGNGFDEPHAVAVAPDGSRVFVTGESTGSTRTLDYATVAYAATG